MEAKELLSKYSPILKQNLIPLSLAFLGMIFLVYGLIVLIGGNQGGEISLESKSQDEFSKSAQDKITVDIEGSIVKPGIYVLTLDSRIQNLLVISGGLSQDADRAWVAKNINLASKLKDGAKIYIPKIGEKAQTLDSAINQEGLVNINTATQEELDALSGIGPVTAKKIISARPYSSVDELLSKKILSSSVFSKIKSNITAE